MEIFEDSGGRASRVLQHLSRLEALYTDMLPGPDLLHGDWGCTPPPGENQSPRASDYWNAVKVTTTLNVIENIALLGLSFVSSKENYDIHKMYFIIFMVCSELYMVLTCLLLKDHKRRLTTPMEQLAYKKKKQLMTANLTSFFIALYFFYRHNTYCEPGSKFDE
ncbi:post-GPI attachment to proteins factor 2 [Penaeus vannamei]|uniref:post-GPI attachment to proteins factor 2 n=1 Tax=Penaeus vannamei TaxID=6689 RepID=UPI00387F71AD